VSQLVEFQDVSVDYGAVSAVAGVSLALRPGETYGLVGESGCGKTTLATALLGLLPESAHVSGRILFRGDDLVTMPEPARRALRGDRIGTVFQDPVTSLDPTFGIGFQVAETIRAHTRISRGQARDRALALLRQVGIPAAEHRYGDPPHRLSGGMRQRVVLACAVANSPDLLIADEPTTALDVTIQAQILDLLARLQQDQGTTILLVTHDLGVVAQVCDRVGVMYAGQLVEEAPVTDLFDNPTHPYTRALLDALPSSAHRGAELRAIGGQVPDLADPPAGCRFKQRCPHRLADCDHQPVLAADGDRRIACWLAPASRAAADLPVTAQVGDSGA
jgi:peptide/nickel transport system ATP-binding protein